jgi:hypothetical protein
MDEIDLEHKRDILKKYAQLKVKIIVKLVGIEPEEEEEGEGEEEMEGDGEEEEWEAEEESQGDQLMDFIKEIG